MRAVVSTKIADIFRSNSLKNGLIPVVVDTSTHEMLLANPGIEATIDLETQTLTTAGGGCVEFPLDGFARYCLMQGVDQLGYLLQQSAAIDSFEEGRTWKP